MTLRFPLAAIAACCFAFSAAAQTTTGLDSEARSKMSDAELFATTAASSDMFEIASSKVALERAQRPEVKAFAQHMIADHTASTQKLTAAAEAAGLPPLSAPDSKHAEMIKVVEQAKGDFDTTFVNRQVNAHQEAVELFKNYAANGDNEALKAFAAETLPTLEQHLAMVQALD